MNGVELRNARRTLGEMWGLGRPLTMLEMAQVLRLTGSDSAATIRDYESGKKPVSGPISAAVGLMLDGARPSQFPLAHQAER